MSLDFVIIPITKKLETAAYDIRLKTVSSIKIDTIIEIDCNYNNSLASRISKWKKYGYDIIIVGEDYIETNSIIVRFVDKGSKPKSMELEQFIDLVSSFDYDTYDNINENNTNENDKNENDKNENNSKEDNDSSGCIIM